MKNLRTKLAKLCRSRGAVLHELVIALPLLFIILIGLIESGFYMCQLVWSIQVAFQAAYAGAESQETDRLASMDSVYEKFSPLHNVNWQKTPLTLSGLTASWTAETDPDDPNVVEAAVSGETRQIWKTVKRPLVSTVKVPILALSNKALGTGFTGFDNPPEFYDCCGRVCPDPAIDCSTSACVSCSGNSCRLLDCL